MTCMYVDDEEGGCGKAGSKTSTWDVGELCDAHYEEITKIYSDKGKVNIPGDVLDDFVKVHVLLQFNVEKCLVCINKLGQEMSVAKRNAENPSDPRFLKANDEDNYLKLSRALEYYEGYCWFPANRTMFTGVLRTEDFYKYVKYGFNKDPGPGPLHGDQSHRIQWHVIMRCMTNNFTTPVAAGWKHSPLGLFYEYTQGSGKDTKAWAISMDKPGNKGWGNPDRVTYSINKSGNVPLIIDEALRRRMAKMGGVDLGSSDDGTESALGTKFGKFHSDLRDSHRREVTDTPEAMGLYAHKKVLSRDYERQRDEHGNAIKNVLIKKNAPDRLVEIDQNRVIKSIGGFNPDYVYGDAAGARPQVPQYW